jgi:homogentisate 1,2-dioxygenase
MVQPHAVAYSRNGFVGPYAIAVKPDYIIDYRRLKGGYAPHRFDPTAMDRDIFADPRALPVPVLRDNSDDRLSVEISVRAEAMPFAVRNVYADEVHLIAEGSATLQTEFGVLPLRPHDVVLIPRAINYRIVDVQVPLTEWVVLSQPALSIAMAAGFGPLRRLDSPAPYAEGASTTPGDYELVIRHGDQLTSVFYDFDPVPGAVVDGVSPVQRLNMNDLNSIDLSGEGLLLPPKIIQDDTDTNLFYDLSARKGDRPGIHYNADFDELGFYLGGPGAWGDVSVPGMLTHVPKGFPHQGPTENVAQGYRAVLLETRARLTPTVAGAEIGCLIETDQFGVHPSAAALL